MPKIILYIATSIDGFIAREDGSVDWLSEFQSEEGSDYGYSEFYSSIDALVMGANTYKQVKDFGEWVYTEKQTYVMTSADLSSSRRDISFFKGTAEEFSQQIKDLNYQCVWLVGGGQLVRSFMQSKLVDEIIITIIPVILGSGIALFKEIPGLNLNLVNNVSHPDGLVTLSYTPI